MNNEEKIKKIIHDSKVFFKKHHEEILKGINEIDKITREAVMEKYNSSKKRGGL